MVIRFSPGCAKVVLVLASDVEKAGIYQYRVDRRGMNGCQN